MCAAYRHLALLVYQLRSRLCRIRSRFYLKLNVHRYFFCCSFSMFTSRKKKLIILKFVLELTSFKDRLSLLLLIIEINLNCKWKLHIHFNASSQQLHNENTFCSQLNYEDICGEFTLSNCVFCVCMILLIRRSSRQSRIEWCLIFGCYWNYR